MAKKTHYGQTHGGKGSARRNSNEQAYRDNWDNIFGQTRSNVNDRKVNIDQTHQPHQTDQTDK